MTPARRFLTAALLLTLAACASSPTKPPAYAPPSIDCRAFDPPAKPLPDLPAAGERDPTVLRLNIFAWMAYAHELLGQRGDTAECLATYKAAGVIR